MLKRYFVEYFPRTISFKRNILLLNVNVNVNVLEFLVFDVS